MPEVLIDSNVYIDLKKGRKHHQQPWAISVLRHMIRYRAAHGEPFLSTVSVAEILRGFHRDIDPSKANIFRQEVQNDYQVIDFDLSTSFLAGEIVARLDEHGKSIGAPDTFIAATAIKNDSTLVTSDIADFQRVIHVGFPLKLVNWREP